MHLKINTIKSKNGTYKYAKLVESYWDHNKNYSRQKIILNFGRLNSDEDLKKCQRILQQHRQGNEFVKLNDLHITSSKSYGVFHITKILFKKYGITKILKKELSSTKHKCNIFDIIQALIVNRLENPLSKNKAFDYIKQDYPFEIDCKKDDLYSAMDVLQNKKETIEFQLFETLRSKLNLNLSKAHYDITSSYFEGHKCAIAMYGYSRDHRRDRKQIVIGLVLVDNIPTYHEVFEGNTQDKTTVTDVVDKLRNKFGLKTTTIIGDRGMLTEANIQNLESKNQDYILGFSKDGNKITEEILQMDIPIKESKSDNAKITKSEKITFKSEDKKEITSTRGYVLCIDKNTKKEQLETLDDVREFIENELTNLRKNYLISQNNKSKNKQSYENLVPKVKKVIRRNKKLFDITWKEKKPEGFEFKLNNSWYERERKAAGKFVIITNKKVTNACNILKSYKELNTVESSFNCVKNQLGIRPINHYKELRVKAHVFICILSLLIEKIMERQLKDMTAQNAIDELKRIKVCNVETSSSMKRILTKISLKQKEVLKKLNINI